MVTDPKVRYSDEELQEFKALIDAKLEQAKAELSTTEQQISDLNENGFNQQGGDWYDDSTAHTDLEMLQRMLTRQQRYVQDLKNALLRIQNKTYGICSVTGHLIDKERLKVVPHATKSIDGKNIANASKGMPADNGEAQGGSDEERSNGKPIGDKVRLPQGKRPARNNNGEEWEIDNETMEDAGYQNRKFEEGDEE